MIKAQLLLIFVVPLLAFADPPGPAAGSVILGEWKYNGFFYQDHRYPLPNPDLDLRFVFDQSGISTLTWDRKNDEHCSRTAQFDLPTPTQVHQKVTALDPKNSNTCGKDPDMQMGRETVSNFKIMDTELWLEFEVNGQPFYYILTHLAP